MVKKSEFERGDIVLVGFDPASGHEQQGAGRPALVLSVQAFNQLGMTLVAPLGRAEILPVMPDLAFLYIAKKAMCTAWCW